MSLDHLGWDEFFRAQLEGELTRLTVARVVEEQRGRYRLSGDFEGAAEVSGRFRHEAASAADFPAVGDWVGVKCEPGADLAVIHHRLVRRSSVSRRAVGRAGDEQVLAANVDTIFLVTALSRDLNPRRLDRYLTVVRDAGATPVVVLNKADQSDDPLGETARIRGRLPFVDVLAVSALQSEGLVDLKPYLQPARTVALLGSSGVGKSTIVNRLLGRDLLNTGAIRDADEKGRHTTTSRQLVELPGGALLIDTPGMRELQPWADEAAVDDTFEDIAELAGRCRFTDCAHETEPGCAVMLALETGALDAGRLDSYRRLLREAAFEERKRDPLAAAEQKKRWKRIHQAQKDMYRDRGRS